MLNQRPPGKMTYAGAAAVPLTLTDKVEPLEIVVAWMRGVRLTRRSQKFVKLCRSLYAHPP